MCRTVFVKFPQISFLSISFSKFLLNLVDDIPYPQGLVAQLHAQAVNEQPHRRHELYIVRLVRDGFDDVGHLRPLQVGECEAQFPGMAGYLPRQLLTGTTPGRAEYHETE